MDYTVARSGRAALSARRAGRGFRKVRALMKTCNLSLATVVLGALAVCYSACSAQGQDNTIPGGTTGPRNTGGSGEVAGTSSSSGGSGPVVTGSGGSAVAHPNGGSPPASSGGSHFNTGVGGAIASSGGHGPTVGTGGSGTSTTPGGCTAAVGAATELAIDDLEDGDNVINPIGSRVGYWYTYNDGTATQVPDPKALFKPTAPGSTLSPKGAASTSGPAFTTYGAGMGFDFHNIMMTPCLYDATAYKGITFYAKATAALAIKAMVKTAATTSSSSGGTCAAKCDDHFALKAALTTAWTKYTITFGAATFAQEGFGTAATFDKTKLLGMQFQVAKDLKFDFSVDDLTFF